MSKIIYAVSGEGRGHAMRARTLIEELKSDHRIVVYAPHLAHDILSPAYRTDRAVAVRRIPGLRFHYAKARRLDFLGTGWRSLGYLSRLSAAVGRMVRDLEEEQPDLAITDFEPILPRAARRLGIPFISLDHQHFLTAYDLRSLPLRLRCYAAAMALVVRAYYRGQAATVVSSFYFPPLRRRVRGVTQIGVLLRPEILDARPQTGGHLLAYLRRFESRRVLAALADCGREVRIYGLGEAPDRGPLRFRPIDVEGFADDLASCRGLVTTAGNQLIGEAQYLGKPVLAMPERGNPEQEINAHFLRQSGTGMAVEMDAFTADHVRALLADAERLVARIDRRRLCGNSVALAQVQRYLPAATPEPSAPPPKLSIPIPA